MIPFDCSLFLAVFLGIMVLGFILNVVVYDRARADLHVFEDLGWESILSAFGTFNARSWRFFLYGHFKHQDRILSALCMTVVAVGIVLAALLLWRLTYPPGCQ